MHIEFKPLNQVNTGPIGKHINVDLLAHNPYPIFEQMMAHEPVCQYP